MRIGLIAALRTSEDGGLRAQLPLAGRSVLAWQVALLHSLGAERVLCLVEAAPARAEDAHWQDEIERAGTGIALLKGFSALPALVRAEDDLVILADGLVPDPEVVHKLLAGEPAGRRIVATFPDDHPLALAHPDDFERIDASRCWAGVLAMRGAPVQHLADMPPDGDAISLLLRLALQAGTPCLDAAALGLVPEGWLLADRTTALVAHETGLLSRAAAKPDWRAPGHALALGLVRMLAPRGVARGGMVAGVAGLVLLFGASLLAALGPAPAALALAAAGAFAAQMALGFTGMARRLRREAGEPRASDLLALAVDGLASLTLWFALSPWPSWQPLAALGPVVIGLARLVARAPAGFLARTAPDRAGLFVLLGAAAMLERLPEAVSCAALGLLAALLLRGQR